MLKSKEELHDELNVLLPLSDRRALIHALIDLGRVDDLVCMYQDCPFERTFSVGHAGTHRHPLGLTIDHTDGRTAGDRPENIAILHFSCNSSKGGKDGWKSVERQRKHLEQLGKQPAEHMRHMTIKGQTPEARAKRKVSMKAHWADPEKAARHAQSIRENGRWSPS